MKVAVLGTSGMIGHRVLIELSKCGEFDIHSFSRREVESLLVKYCQNKVHFFSGVNFLDFETICDQLKVYKPDVVINCSGLTIRKIGPDLIREAFEINSIFPKKLSIWCNQSNCRFIHLSTDCVFSGKTGPYRETSIPDATDIYGQSKFLGENLIGRALVLRFSAIGRELFDHTELLDWFLLKSEASIKGFSRVIYSGITTTVLAKEVVRVLKKYQDLKGLYQISSGLISKYDLLKMINNEFGLNKEILEEAHTESSKILLSNEYQQVTGFKPAPWIEMIKELNEDSSLYKKVGG